MHTEAIAEVGLDDERRIFVRPESGDFEHIYRAGMGIYWDPETRRLFHLASGDWTPARWFNQIAAAAAAEYRIRLELNDKTAWSNVPVGLRSEIEARP